jgi:chemotaxis response regulator CheB
MPEKFTAMYAQRLDGLCAMNVREARDGDRLERGVALIAPGGRHLQLRKAGGQYFAVVLDGPPVNRHKPSVDVLFRSAADCAGRDVLAIILTGMGDDGARGMKAAARQGRTHHRAERGNLRRLRHAQGGHCRRGGGRCAAAAARRRRDRGLRRAGVRQLPAHG